MLRRFLPKETNFFDFFEQHSGLIIKGCEIFRELCADGGHFPDFAVRLKEVEHQADEITHRCIEALHKTFITPIDRNEIHHLIKQLDDIVDLVEAAVARIILFEINEIRPEARELGEILMRASQEIAVAVHGLRDMRHAGAIVERCIAVHELENKADMVHRTAMGRLFKDDLPVLDVIKWKEIFQRLEGAADRCEDVANIIEGIVIEAT